MAEGSSRRSSRPSVKKSSIPIEGYGWQTIKMNPHSYTTERELLVINTGLLSAYYLTVRIVNSLN
jgi:hypothetical protein